MPQVIITEGAAQGLERCRQFLAKKSTRNVTCGYSYRALFSAFGNRCRGRPFDDLPLLRELVIPFGDSGYVALYRYEQKDDSVFVLAFRHQKEAGYA